MSNPRLIMGNRQKNLVQIKIITKIIQLKTSNNSKPRTKITINPAKVILTGQTIIVLTLAFNSSSKQQTKQKLFKNNRIRTSQLIIILVIIIIKQMQLNSKKYQTNFYCNLSKTTKRNNKINKKHLKVIIKRIPLKAVIFWKNSTAILIKKQPNSTIYKRKMSTYWKKIVNRCNGSAVIVQRKVMEITKKQKILKFSKNKKRLMKKLESIFNKIMKKSQK